MERARHGRTYGLDLCAPTTTPQPIPEYRRVDDMPEADWRDLDLFLGVTGISVLQRNFFERLLLRGTARQLFFASGSTKNIEFADLVAWMNELGAADRGVVGGHTVRLETGLVRDPQHEFVQGHWVRIRFPDNADIPGTTPGAREKTIYLLGDVMPINFLYYGVPGEVIDGVLEELFCLVSGVAAGLQAGRSYTPDIYAVDQNINKLAEQRS